MKRFLLVALLFLIPLRVSAAVGVVDVQSTFETNATTKALPAFGTNPSNGDTVVVAYSMQNYANFTSKLVPTDNFGNTYALLSALQGGSTNGIAVYYAENIVGGASFVVTARPNQTAENWTAVAWCITGVSRYNGDLKSAGAGFGAIATGTSSPAPAANSIFLAFVSVRSTSAATADTGAGWNAVSNGFTSGMATNSTNNGASASAVSSEYKMSSSALDATFGNPGNVAWAAIEVSFRPRTPSTTPIVDVQSGGHASSASYALPAFANNPGTGDTVIVGYALSDFTVQTAPLVPTDNFGNTYVQIGTTQNGTGGWNIAVLLFASFNVVGGSSFVVTVKPGVGSVQSYGVAWCLGSVVAAPYNSDFKKAGAGSGAVATGTTSPAPSAMSMFVGVSVAASGQHVTGSGFNTTGVDGFTTTMATSSQNGSLSSEYKKSTSALSFTWTNPTNNVWVAMGASYLLSAPPPSTFLALTLAP